MKKTLYVSFGVSASQLFVYQFEWLLRQWPVDFAYIHLVRDQFGWFDACPQMACDGIFIAHLASERIRYNLLEVPNSETREKKVPVLFLGISGVSHSTTCIGVRTDSYQRREFSHMSELIPHFLEFCGFPAKFPMVAVS